MDKDDDPRRGPRDPFDEWRERMAEDPFLGPFFSDIDREFERMRESLSRMLQGMGEGEPGKDPFVYGFSVRMGQDGKPQFREFGNVKPMTNAMGGEVEVQNAREPLVDVHEGDATISITAELPGVEKEDINVRAKEREILVRVNDGERRYFKRIDLPCAVKPETTSATYKNGVLDVELEKAEGVDEGTEVPIE